MWDNILPILLGFVLTTVIGGLFASLLQQRSWRYQNAARLREEELDRVVYAAFRDAGDHLEDLYHQSAGADAVGKASAELTRLNHLAYQVGVTMMVRVREQRVGRAAPTALGEVALTDTGR